MLPADETDAVEGASVDLGGQLRGSEPSSTLQLALAARPTLTLLELSDNALADAGATALVHALRTSRPSALRFLGLARNGIGDVGGTAIAAWLGDPPPALEHLELRDNALADVAAAALARALGRNSTLQHLSLFHNMVGLVGAQALASALRANRTLTSMDLRLNLIDQRALQRMVSRSAANDAPTPDRAADETRVGTPGGTPVRTPQRTLAGSYAPDDGTSHRSEADGTTAASLVASPLRWHAHADGADGEPVGGVAGECAGAEPPSRAGRSEPRSGRVEGAGAPPSQSAGKRRRGGGRAGHVADHEARGAGSGTSETASDGSAHSARNSPRVAVMGSASASMRRAEALLGQARRLNRLLLLSCGGGARARRS